MIVDNLCAKQSTNKEALLFSKMSDISPALLIKEKYGLPIEYISIWVEFSQLDFDKQTSGNLAWYIADYEYRKDEEEMIQGDEYYELNVYMSSTFAAAMKVCHDYGYFYLDEYEYKYAEGRGGTWCQNYNLYEKDIALGKDVFIGNYIISLHEVFTYLDRIHIIRKMARNNVYNLLSVCKFTKIPTDQKLEILTFT